MVLLFAPVSNDSGNVCQGIQAYQAHRPPIPARLFTANLILFILTASVYLFGLVLHWRWRDRPRFRKVRPFFLAASLVVGLVMYHAAAYLMYVVSLPCAMVIVFYTLALTWCIVFPTVRLLAILLETRFAVLSRENTNDIFDGDGSSALWSKDRSAGKLWLLTRVMLSPRIVDTLSIEEVVAVKKSYAAILLLHSVPAFITIILLLALVPAYQTCYDCDVFLELPIACTVLLVIYIAANLRMSIEAYRKVGWDEKGVIIELLQVPLVAAPVCLVVWILMIFDPGHVTFDNEFNWSMLFFIITLTWWSSSFGYQFYVQWNQDQSTMRNTTERITNMNEVFARNPKMKKAFIEFAERHFIVESLQFMEDISTFKTFYFEKAENWRLSKFRLLVEKYIIAGALSEINISYSMKLPVLEAYSNLAQGSKISEDLVTIFDKAYVDVETMVQNGTWTDFLKKDYHMQSEVCKNAARERAIPDQAAAEERRREAERKRRELEWGYDWGMSTHNGVQDWSHNDQALGPTLKALRVVFGF